MHWLLESNIDLFQKSCRVIASRCDELEIVVCRNNTFKLAAKYRVPRFGWSQWWRSRRGRMLHPQSPQMKAQGVQGQLANLLSRACHGCPAKIDSRLFRACGNTDVKSKLSHLLTLICARMNEHSSQAHLARPMRGSLGGRGDTMHTVSSNKLDGLTFLLRRTHTGPVFAVSLLGKTTVL